MKDEPVKGGHSINKPVVSPVSVAKEEELTPEKKLIAEREAGKIPVQDFLAGLAEVKSDYARYWEVINGVLKGKRVIRTKDLLPFAKRLNAKQKKETYKLNFIGGILRKLAAWGLLFSFKKANVDYYLSDLPDFYTPEELCQEQGGILPKSEVEYLISKVDNTLQSSKQIGTQAYHDRHNQSLGVINSVLQYALGQKWTTTNKTGDKFKLNPSFQVLGIEGLATQALLNNLYLEKLRGGEGPSTLEEAIVAQEAELAEKTTSVVEIESSEKGDLPWMLFWGEAQIGALLSDLKFQKRAYELFENRLPKELKPTHIITSGTVYGEHRWIQNDLRRTEQESLSKYGWQLRVARDLMEKLKRIRKTKSGKVIERLGRWDAYMAEQFAHTVIKAERAARFHGIDTATLSLEERRAFMNRDYDQHRRLQYMTIQIYQRLTKPQRTVLNEKEVEQKIGRRVSEVRLLIETISLLKKGEPVPEANAKVIDMEALDKTLHPEKQNPDEYIVTPSNIHFKCGDITGAVFYDMSHTPVPQRTDPFLTLDKRVRGLQSLNEVKAPNIVAVVHPQRLVGQYYPVPRGENGTLGITLPSLKNLTLLAEGRLEGFYEGVKEDESWRQLTIRREITQPGLVMVRGGKYNCYDLMLIDDRVMKIIEANKDKPEERKIIAHVSDTHWGGMPMTPELTIRFMSLALFEMGAHVLWLNGDWDHGRNYLQSFHESAKTTLISMDKQLLFGTEAVLKPFLRKEVAPNLEEVTAHDGNHEYNTIGVALTGWAGLRSAVQAASDIFEATGRNATSWFSGTIKLDGDTFKWPYYHNKYCGYKIAMTHNVFPKGKDPQFFSINWFEGLAAFARDLFLLACGDRHHLKFVRWLNTYAFWFGRMCLQSGYEWFHGLKGEWMPGIIDLSNKRPPIIHLISRDFLEQYKCKDPFFGPMEEKDELTVYAYDGTPWVYDSVPFCYSKYINEWLKRLHSSKPPSLSS